MVYTDNHAPPRICRDPHCKIRHMPTVSDTNASRGDVPKALQHANPAARMPAREPLSSRAAGKGPRTGPRKVSILGFCFEPYCPGCDEPRSDRSYRRHMRNAPRERSGTSTARAEGSSTTRPSGSKRPRTEMGDLSLDSSGRPRTCNDPHCTNCRKLPRDRSASRTSRTGESSSTRPSGSKRPRVDRDGHRSPRRRRTRGCQECNNFLDEPWPSNRQKADSKKARPPLCVNWYTIRVMLYSVDGELLEKDCHTTLGFLQPKPSRSHSSKLSSRRWKTRLVKPLLLCNPRDACTRCITGMASGAFGSIASEMSSLTSRLRRSGSVLQANISSLCSRRLS